jgi:DNA mismatch endonuclease (patch repair protein)
MADVLTAEQRRLNMSRIRSRNTKPEMIVRSVTHRLGYRYRLHCKDLPGSPDLVFRSRRKVIFVHGCFFHKHNCRYGRAHPKTNSAFWKQKRSGNVARDNRNLKELTDKGWNVLVVWECMTKKSRIDDLPKTIVDFLNS